MTGSLLRQRSGFSRPESESREDRERRLWPRAPRVQPLRFRRAPLLAAAVSFALGEAIAKASLSYTRPAILLLFATLSLTALTLFSLQRSRRIVLLPITALWFAAGLWALQAEPAPSPQTALLAYADGLSRTVQARIVRIRKLPPRQTASQTTDFDPDQWDETGTPAYSIDLDLTAIEDVTPDLSRMVAMTGGVRATLLASSTQEPQLHCGDLIEASLRLRIPERYRDPGAWQYADFLLDQGIAATANVSNTKLHAVPGRAPAPYSATLRCRLYATQTWAADRMIAFTLSPPNRKLPPLLRLSPDDAGMLNAMLFGDRSRLNHPLRLGFERTGSFHLFVVSGMHVALLAGALFWITRKLRLREALATTLILVLTSAYALLTGFAVPVQRALLMTAVFLAARLLFRDRNALNALGAAALVVLIGSPHALFEASFQMTFLAIVAIAGIAIPLGERSLLAYAHAARNLDDRWVDTALPPRLTQFRIMLRLWGEAFAATFSQPARKLPALLVRTLFWAAELAFIGLIAEAIMMLPMAIYFHRATVFALPANMVSIPLVAILAPLGIATFCAALLNPWLAIIPGAATALLLHAIVWAIERVGHAQAADLRLPGPTFIPSLVAVALFTFCCWAVRRSRTFSRAAFAALPLAAAIILWPQPPAVHRNQLEVTAIDVGQGDSLLVAGPSGRTMLIDAGGPTGAAANAENAGASASAFDIGEEVVSPYLWSRQIHRLDVVALTHAHSDHMGGMPAVLRNLRPRELWVSLDSSAPAYRALLDEAASLNIAVRHLRAGDSLTWDSIAVAILAPAPAYTNTGPPINNDSLVLHLQFGQSSVLLEGDAESPSERTMLASGKIGPVTLLKVGHHGSRTSTTPDFLARTAPQDAVISVGRQNTFGHPRPEIVARLAAAHTRLYRTDAFGLTTFLLSRDGKISAYVDASPP